MRKPNNFEETQENRGFQPLQLGGHICRIMGVTETTSKTDRAMIVVALDIEEGEQKGYYANQYRLDDRPNKKWGCNVYILIEDNDGNTSKAFKTFVMAVERSNAGFDHNKIWDEHFCDYFKNKLIGGVFGREEYMNQSGQKKMITKCFYFRDTETIRKGVPVPEDRLLDEPTDTMQDLGFSPADDDDDLPF